MFNKNNITINTSYLPRKRVVCSYSNDDLTSSHLMNFSPSCSACGTSTGLRVTALLTAEPEDLAPGTGVAIPKNNRHYITHIIKQKNHTNTFSFNNHRTQKITTIL